MSKLKPTPPPFEAKAKKGANKTQKAVKKPEPAPVLVTGERVTAGPFHDDRAPRPYEPWTVITRRGDIVTYYRFRSREDAELKCKSIQATS